MSEEIVTLDPVRLAALKAAVSAGGASSIDEASASALDAWLTDQALARADDAVLRALWDEGTASGAPDMLDIDAFKLRARRAAGLD